MSLGNAETVRISKTTHFRLDSYLFVKASEQIGRNKRPILLMTYEKFYSSHEYDWGWRCISCGEVFDQIVSENRRASGKRRDLKSDGREEREAEKDETL